MFHFKRRTLWIIIYITIPLIIVLNRLGPELETDDDAPAELLSQWSLDEIALDCDEEANERICVLPLDKSADVYISAVLDRLPLSSVPIPEGVTLSTYSQGGYFIGTAQYAARTALAPSVTEFFSNWLPQGSKVDWVVSGPGDPSELAAVAKRVDSLVGVGTELLPDVPKALATLDSPALGDQDQLAFLMWIEILKQRLAGYSVQVTWDHRQRTSRVQFNTTLSPDVFSPAKETELEPILSAYVASSLQRVRQQNPLHRYAVTAVVYDVPFEYFIQQPERLSQIDLAAVNRMREFSLEQITQEKP